MISTCIVHVVIFWQKLKSLPCHDGRQSRQSKKCWAPPCNWIFWDLHYTEYNRRCWEVPTFLPCSFLSISGQAPFQSSFSCNCSSPQRSSQLKNWGKTKQRNPSPFSTIPIQFTNQITLRCWLLWPPSNFLSILVWNLSLNRHFHFPITLLHLYQELTLGSHLYQDQFPIDCH